jgi:predicted acylesterase/phospholipase RssA
VGNGAISRLLLSAGVAAFIGCSYAKTPYLLQALNSGAASSGTPPVRPAADVRIGRLVRTQMADSYFDVLAVASWMQKAAAQPSPIADQLGCLRAKRTQPEICYRAFDLNEIPAGSAGKVWGLDPPPDLGLGAKKTTSTRLRELDDRALQKEMDIERFAANARSLAVSILAFEDILGRTLTDAELRAGVATGMHEAAQYISARAWHRNVTRPTTAIVLSGGAATGAFTAGFVWRLLDVLDGCHHAPDANGKTMDACPSSSIDLVVGSSTGSLVGVLVDLFHTAGQETRSRDLLMQNYTCSTERDLYCVHDEYDWKLATSLRGLVRFDGIEKKLDEATALGTMQNRTEMVAVSVEFDSGDLYAQSDQDPADETDRPGWVQAVLASIVEPVMADPVDGLPEKGGKGKIPGTFIDGGIRSALPVLEAAHRGAERTLVIGTSSLDPAPNAHAASALPILLRTIDLATDQVLVGEVQQAELSAAVRRLVEYRVCRARLGVLAKSPGDTAELERFCRRTGLFPPRDAHAEVAAATYIGPQLFEEVAQVWKSEWVYRPESGGPGAVGYSFDPRLMRELFKQGVRTFQLRCDETLSLFMVPAALRNSEDVCKLNADAAAARAEAKFRPIDQCHPDDHRLETCP